MRYQYSRASRENGEGGVTGPLHKNNAILIGTWPKILQISNPVICNLGEVKLKRLELAAAFSPNTQRHTRMCTLMKLS